MAQKFIDREKSGNLRDGVEYFAVGLIVEWFVDSCGPGSPSGKDCVVEYIDPWGELQSCWRSKDEIEISDIDDSDAELLRYAYREAEKYASNAK